MKKKQILSNEEASILLQSQPLSASLWQLAGESLDENIIRFPDPSYVDSQNWPDYITRKKRNGQKSNGNKTVETKQELIQEQKQEIKNDRIQINMPYQEPEESEIVRNENLNEHEEIRKREKQNEELKNVENEMNSEEAEYSKPLDFYQWLERLTGSDAIAEEASKPEKSKARTRKPSQETIDAKTAAANSLVLGDEIVSETLARLLARQGHKEQAIDMYQKLIAKYPEKEATFAAALEKLKS